MLDMPAPEPAPAPEPSPPEPAPAERRQLRELGPVATETNIEKDIRRDIEKATERPAPPLDLAEPMVALKPWQAAVAAAVLYALGLLTGSLL